MWPPFKDPHPVSGSTQRTLSPEMNYVTMQISIAGLNARYQRGFPCLLRCLPMMNLSPSRQWIEPGLGVNSV